MKSRSIPSLATASLLALAVPAFAADDDAEFVKKAASGGMLEVELGKHVAAHAADANVRSFAQRMVTDHGKANQELKAVASAAGLRVPSELDAKHREKLAELSALKGEALDDAYMKEMVEDHEHDVAAFREQAEQAESPIDRWAAKTVPTLEAHLAQAKSVSQRVGDVGAGRPAMP
jgi:putative membrane protein